MPELLLQVRDLTIQFHPSPDATVKNVSFNLFAAETVGLVGESGCGKTTLARALLGLLSNRCSCKTGSVRFLGEDLAKANSSRLQHIRGNRLSLIAQEPELALNPVISIGKQIEGVLVAHRRCDRQTRRREVESILHAVGLSEPGFYSAFPHQLSGGQRQRVVIAQALICNPAVLIADEPTSSIDAITESAILSLLRTMQQRLRLSVLYITHDLDLLRGFATRLLVMHAGQIVEQGPFAEVYRSPCHHYTKELLSSIPAWPVCSHAG